MKLKMSINVIIFSFCCSDSFSLCFRNNGRNSSFCPVPVMGFISDTTGYINEEAIYAINETTIIAKKSTFLIFFYLCFTVPVVPSINTNDLSSDSTILIISFIFSFETNKVNPFPALTVPHPSNTDEVALGANLNKKSLAKGATWCNNPFFLNYS